MRTVGITCGIGSMLVGARAAGFAVEGNVEWRKYYHQRDEHGRNTFTENFPGASFPHSLDEMTTDEIERWMGVELAMGHPECGNFSQLSGANKNRHESLLDPADIPLFVDAVARLRPRFFVMDDLPKSFLAYPMSRYAERLPDYDLFPEWVSNWGYGNVQRGRNRMFMLGSLKQERWAFRPGEQEHPRLVRDVLDDLPAPRPGANVPNHDPHDMRADCQRSRNASGIVIAKTWADVRKLFSDKPGGWTFEYPTASGKIVKRIGFLRGHWDGPSHVLHGGNAILHGLRCDPLTIRERARIQGFPDDFVFYGTKLNSRGEWNHETNKHMVRQTGKAMPVQFCQYAAEQVAAKVQGKKFSSSGRRVLPPSPHVDEAKQWYCREVGYADQAAACGACWMSPSCKIKTTKYKLEATA